MNYNKTSARRGTVALFIALLITGILFITVMANFRSGKQYRYVMKKSFLEFQAQYMAQAALQHVELKIRYFPTELIDASDLSKGRNPFFDFTELSATEYGNLAPIRQGEYKQDPVDSSIYFHIASPFNMGPRFVSEGTISTDNSKKWFELDTLDTEDTDPTKFGAKESLWFPSGWPTLDGIKVKNSDLYLWKFFNDINTDAAIQPALTCTKDVNFDIGTPNSIPYSSGYQIMSLEVLSQKEHRRLNQEAIKVAAVGWAIDPITNASSEIRMERVIKVSRR